jgi:hypothetical protein
MVKTKGKAIVLLYWVGFFSFQIYDWIDPFIFIAPFNHNIDTIYLNLYIYIYIYIEREREREREREGEIPFSHGNEHT